MRPEQNQREREKEISTTCDPFQFMNSVSDRLQSNQFMTRLAGYHLQFHRLHMEERKAAEMKVENLMI